MNWNAEVFVDSLPHEIRDAVKEMIPNSCPAVMTRRAVLEMWLLNEGIIGYVHRITHVVDTLDILGGSK